MRGRDAMKIALVVSIIFAVVGISLAYNIGTHVGSREPTSAESQLSESWNRSADSTDRLIQTLKSLETMCKGTSQ